MSHAGDEHDEHDGDHAAHAHDFDGEPSTELPADEPRTPAWLPLVGAAIFTAGFVFWLSRPSEAAETSDAGAATATAATNAAPQRPAPSPQQPHVINLGTPTAQPAPSLVPLASAKPAASGAPRQLTPEQRQRVMEALKKRGGGKP